MSNLNVPVPPDIDDTGTSSDVTVEEGNNVTLSCSATGHPEPRILWRREDGDHITLQQSSQEAQKGSHAAVNFCHYHHGQMMKY